MGSLITGFQRLKVEGWNHRPKETVLGLISSEENATLLLHCVQDKARDDDPIRRIGFSRSAASAHL
jgi:hypothetical protein